MCSPQVMLEITGQLQLVPFVALAAMVATFTASMFSDHGLYHALIHQMGLPYLPLERGSDKDHEHAAHGGQRRSALDLCCRWLFSECWCYRTWTAPKKDPVLVKEVMATPVACVERGQTKSDIQSCLKDESHNAFPGAALASRNDAALAVWACVHRHALRVPCAVCRVPCAAHSDLFRRQAARAAPEGRA
jgi:hypothetical protein